MSNDLTQKLINAINIQGILFQEKCSKVFKKESWKVIVEYPVMFPKPSFGNFGKDFVIDIWASKKLKNLQIDFLVECKKSDQKLKNWVFFKDKWAEPAGNDHLIFSRNSDGKWETKAFLGDIQKVLKLQRQKRCTAGIELKAQFAKSSQRDDTLATTQRISDACYQAVQATNGTFQEYGDYYSKVKDTALHKNKTTLLILPLIVTTANLLIADYDVEKITEDGILDVRDISFKETNMVLYNYPIPGHIRFSMLDSDIPKINLRKRLVYKKTIVIIVQANYLQSFLKTLS